MTERLAEPKRPDPDQLLAEMQQEERRAARGKLKIFLGAAPGVGKTFAMLEEGRKRTAEGMDVVVGYAEPHARTDTEALLLGMELLPCKFVDYKNVRLKEFDLDAALQRKPALLLVDELAHTNAPGMRHPKRYQDVLEALEAGIDVYTTLNVQHLESLNDIVERITGIRVRETLPDSILEQADEVELVDISPEELIERLGEGKIYTGEMAERAVRNFFNKGNLLALRELALRRTAERVDAQMQEVKREGPGSPWAASERILVGVSPSPLSARLIRSTKRLAAGLRSSWIAVYVETPASAQLSDQDRRRIDQNLKLAEQLGAQVVVLQGEKVAEEINAYAHAHNITKIVIGKPERSKWRDMLLGSVVDDLVRHSGMIDIYVIRGEPDEPPPQPAPPPRSIAPDWLGYSWSVGVVILATVVGWPLYHGFHLPDNRQEPFLSDINVLMLYLLGVLAIATRFGRGPSIVASFLAVAAFDLFFVKPFLRFSVADQQYIFTFIVMLATALIISTLTHRVRLQAEAARLRERRTRILLELTRDLAAARTADQIVLATVRHVSDVLETEATVLLPDAERHLTARADGSLIDVKEFSVAQWAFDHDQPAGAGTGTLPAANGTYVPMKTSRGTVGIMGVFPSTANGSWQPEQRQLAEALASQAALAIERATLAEEARAAWERVEAEFLRNTLLSGVSHELRTPLAGIAGAVSTLIEQGSQLSEAAKLEMLDTVYSEAERMERLITNLLDMTRLESGGIHVTREWQPLQEVIGAALRHMDRRLRGREVKTDVPADLPLVNIDGILIEQVLANLLDNAVEYTPPGSAIEIVARADEKKFRVQVLDNGPGLPVGAEKRVFEKFFRAQTGGTRRGIGLGLAICRGIVEAHGGTVAASNRPDGGAVIEFAIPREGNPPDFDHTN